MQLYEIQKKIVEDNKPVTGIFLGTGVGKTLPTLMLAQGSTLVLSPKQQKVDQTWEDNNRKFGLGKTVTAMSKEEFRRDWDKLPAYDTVVFDECHNFFGVYPETRQRNNVQIPKTSQVFEAAFKYLKKHKPKRLYFVSATPCTKPMHMWAMAKLLGLDWDYYRFRDDFYIRRKAGKRDIWIPRKDKATKDRLAARMRKFGYFGRLCDFMDVPAQVHKEVTISLTTGQKQAIKEVHETEADPLVARARIRTIENGVLYGKKIERISEKESRLVKDTRTFPSEKIDYIIERAIEFPKLLVFAVYTAQIEAIAEALKKEGHNVITVTGASKDRSTVFKEAEAMESVVLVVQAQICEGYRVPSVPCMIFASKSNRFVHYDQALGRIMDGQHLKPNLYIHLVVRGGADEACHKSMMDGTDFQEKLSTVEIDEDEEL